MKGIGRQLSFGIAKEAVRGTAEAAPTFWIPFNDLSLDEKFEMADYSPALGVIEPVSDQKQIKKWAEGSLKAPIGDKHFPLVLMSLLGSLATSDNADTDPTVKDHVVTVGQSAQHQSLTMFLDDPLGAQDYKHPLGVFEELNIKYEVGKILEYEVKFKTKAGAIATLTPAMTVENKFLSQHAVFKMAVTLATLDAAAAMKIRSFNLKISQKIEDDYVLGSATPDDFINGGPSIEGEIEAIWQNETDFKSTALAGTQKALRIDLKNTDVTIGAAANPEIKIDLAKVIFNAITKAVKIDDVVMQTLSFKANYSTADSKMITVTATNAQASY
jgi:hypothetical protein